MSEWHVEQTFILKMSSSMFDFITFSEEFSNYLWRYLPFWLAEIFFFYLKSIKYLDNKF